MPKNLLFRLIHAYASPPITKVLTMPSILFRCGLSIACLAGLCGCLPENTYLTIRFSPDGQLLAIVSEKQGLVIADLNHMEKYLVAHGKIDSDNVAWTMDAQSIAYAGNRDGSLDIYLRALEGKTTRITTLPSLEKNPMVSSGTLLYLTTESGTAELASNSLTGAETPGLILPRSEFGLVTPVLSPTGNYVAAFSFENLRPQIYNINLNTGAMDQLTSETDPFGLVTGSLAWTPDEAGVGFLRGEPSEVVPDGGKEQTELSPRTYAPTGSSFHFRAIEGNSGEEVLIRGPRSLRNCTFDSAGNVIFFSDEKLVLSPPGGPDKVLAMDLPAGLPEPAPDDGKIAFVAAGQLIGITSTSLERARILTFDMEEKFLLAEEYFRLGSRSKSYDLYEELAASVKRTRDPDMARFIYIANLRRLGLTDKAVNEIGKFLSEGKDTGSVPRKYLWRVLGFSYLLELDDLENASESLRRYEELTSDTEEKSSDSALNALEIIERTSSATAHLYARAVKARLDGNFTLTDELFGNLLATAPGVLAVQREYVKALDGFDSEVYYFSPSQRPFLPTRSEKADYFQHFIDVVPTSSSLARDVRLDLFLLRIEMGSYSRARALLGETLSSGSAEARPEGILEVFRNYLETPEPQPWINQAMPEVFLHPDIRPKLETLIVAPEDRLLMAVAATKVALLQNLPDQARREADAAVAEWNRVPAAQQSGELAALFGRLLTLRAREAELRGLYSEAAASYDHAVNVLAEKRVDNFEMQEEIRYRAALLRGLVADYPMMLERLRDIELQTGLEIVNPTWDSRSLMSAVRDYVDIYDSTSGTLKQWSAYESGLLFSKLHRNHQARSAVMLAVSAAAPEFIQRKAMLEVAAIDEYGDDPWNAARWYSRIAALPGTTPDVRMWCSYQIARLHLSINYKVPAAREALSIIVSNRPDTPLAIQAQELLISTSIR